MRDSKQRLRSLDRIDPPDVWHRATRLEPIGDVPPAPQPTWQRRVAAGTVAFAVFAGAIALAMGAFGRNDDPPLVAAPSSDAAVITLEASEQEPRAVLELDGAETEGDGSSFCWTSANVGTCVDVAAVTYRAADFVAIPAGTSVTVEGDARTVDLSTARWIGGEVAGEPTPIPDPPAMPSEPGRYVLTVAATWPQGDRSFTFPVEIEAAGPSATPEPSIPADAPIVVTTPTPGDEITAPVTIAGTADVFEATVHVEILDAVNNTIAETLATATCGSGCRGDFSVEVPYEVDTPQQGLIRVFEESAMDGSRQHVVQIAVTLTPGAGDPVAEAVEGAWTDADGTELPDGTGSGAPLQINVLEGPAHCGWTSATFMHLAWPLGTVSERGDDWRQYIRDPHGLFTRSFDVPFGSDGRFPDDAEPTGMRRGEFQLWIAPGDADESVYVVQGDPTAGAWERWPRADRPMLCD